MTDPRKPAPRRSDSDSEPAAGTDVEEVERGDKEPEGSRAEEVRRAEEREREATEG